MPRAAVGVSRPSAYVSDRQLPSTCRRGPTSSSRRASTPKAAVGVWLRRRPSPLRRGTGSRGATPTAALGVGIRRRLFSVRQRRIVLGIPLHSCSVSYIFVIYEFEVMYIYIFIVVYLSNCLEFTK